MKLGICHVSAKNRLTEAEVERRIKWLNDQGFQVEHLTPSHESVDRYAASTPCERAAQLSYALTQRKLPVTWCARGGAGSVSLVPHLKRMLPPVLSENLIIGYSDISFIGNFLSLHFPEVQYLHYRNAFDAQLGQTERWDWEYARKIIFGQKEKSISFPIKSKKQIEGIAIPVNVSLLPPLIWLSQGAFPENTVLFIEDIKEDLYGLMRSLENAQLSPCFEKIKAFVLGEFVQCRHVDESPMREEDLAEIIERRFNKPTVIAKSFGHGKLNMPILSGCTVVINNGKLTLDSEKKPQEKKEINYKNPYPKSLYFAGIGGTGMASVASLFQQGGCKISGSDNPIYPPMDAVIKRMGVTPKVDYKAENVSGFKEDCIVLSNVLTRRGYSLQTNPELEAILASDLPMTSFPEAMRQWLLEDSEVNVIVSGTHGKTTTSAFCAHAFDLLGEDPSFLIGGQPHNFKDNARLANPSFFILEGDEYDSAFFDKGPKFLHYAPKISLINNIEFDHADIYENLGKIIEEFSRLGKLTASRGGIVVANADCQNVQKSIQGNNSVVLFGESEKSHWQLLKWNPVPTGSQISLRAPNGESYTLDLKLFGHHNAMNAAAVLAIISCYYLLKENKGLDYLGKIKKETVEKWLGVLSQFQGVKRRFELILRSEQDIAVFDDFAHHPTAVESTLKAFKKYHSQHKKPGRLVACFDPRNATMRRNHFEQQLAQSFKSADLVLLGPVPRDKRLSEEEQLNPVRVEKLCPVPCSAFGSATDLLEKLKEDLRPGDTVVFMSSGSFQDLPMRLKAELESGEG